MTNFTLVIPDDVALRLKQIASARHKTVEQLLVERLPSLIAGLTAGPAGSPAAVLQAALAPPDPAPGDVDALEEAIASARLPIRAPEIFPG